MDVSTEQIMDLVSSTLSNLTSTMIPTKQWMEADENSHGDFRYSRAIPYIQTSPTEGTIYLVVMGAMILTGVLGNILILGELKASKSD